MHEAFESAHLLKLATTVQIESLAAYGDNLLVGTRQGHLLMYKVTSRYGDPKHDVQLLRYNKNFSKKPIQQLAIIPEHEILIRLSDNIICVHDVSNRDFPPITTVQSTRGATLFTLDVKHSTSLTGVSSVTVRMCVAVKRKLLFFYWKHGEFLPLMQDDNVTVKDIPRALVWCNETIVVGFKGEYSLVTLPDKTQKDLFPTGTKHQEPSITKVSDDMFVLGKDTQVVLMYNTCYSSDCCSCQTRHRRTCSPQAPSTRSPASPRCQMTYKTQKDLFPTGTKHQEPSITKVSDDMFVLGKDTQVLPDKTQKDLFPTGTKHQEPSITKVSDDMFVLGKDTQGLPDKTQKDLFPTGTKHQEPSITKVSDDMFVLGKDTQGLPDKTQKDLFPTGTKHQEPSITKVSDDMFVLGKDTQSLPDKTQKDLFPTGTKHQEPSITKVSDDMFVLGKDTQGLPDKTQKDLFPTGTKHQEPSITKVSDDMFVLGKDTQSLPDKTQKDLFPTGTKHQEPSITKVSDDMFVLGKDTQSLPDKTQKDLFPTGTKHQEPSITKVSDDMFVLGKDTQSVLMYTAGEAVSNLAVKWSEVPIDLVFDEPYLLALLPESVEVRTVEPHLLIQSLPLKARLACRCRQGVVYAASTEHVWIVQSLPVSKQIHRLLEEKQFQLAVKLTNLSDDLPEEKAKNIHQIKTLYAFDLFHNKKFLDSMKEFLKLDTDPYDVIRLFPMLLPQQARDEPKSSDKSSVKLDDMDLENGLLALIQYLTEVRRKILDKKSAEKGFESKSTQQLMQIIDTTLLKCYLQTNDALVAPLLRRNYCHLEETEHTLRKHHKYSELIILYQTKGLHHKALELLQKQANQSDSSLRGHERTVQYLQTLGEEHVKLIFQFAGWVLEAHPEDGLKIFTEDTPEVEHLPRPQVLDYLLRTQKSLVIPYLEHVVHTWKDTNSIFHNVLIHQYKERVQALLTPNATQQEQQAAQHIKAKLLAFLDKSQHYIPETVLVHFPFDCLFEERAIILGRLGRHEQALSIYVSVLSDIQRAKEYCDKVYKQGGSGADEVYVWLMRLLISPPDNWLVGVTPANTPQPDLETALSLLEGNADRIPPLKALKELPDSVPLIRIKHFLMASLQKQINERRKTQVLKGLLYAEHLQVQELRMQYESQSVMMTETMVCPVCKKRFGNQSAFVRYPNGDIVHYSCQERRSAPNT
ncbi:vam6/Vps39-like protein [Macrosteles quadrilineatus]|uniref:vam6/Vps39-like protein n=1 Tax=Macrosteles quadrilineatus TaxID=74068 RepID=UPI0023E133B0|nr:vam6/Vps39-like protein [Macrosteles quadrilineatus]